MKIQQKVIIKMELFKKKLYYLVSYHKILIIILIRLITLIINLIFKLLKILFFCQKMSKFKLLYSNNNNNKFTNRFIKTIIC